jgi:alkyl hydroperoxide reductase subunit AhpC
MKNKLFFLFLIVILSTGITIAQKIVSVSDTMPNFTLLTYEGKQVSLSDYKGKNVMLVFPRGKVADHWCQICHYQYAELADLEMKEKIQGKYNLQIIFILPYDQNTVKNWVNMLPKQMAIIENWKNPGDLDKIAEGQKNWMMKCRKLFPKKFDIDSTNIPKPFPVIADGDRKLSMDLGLFTTYWDNSYVEQNISSIFLIDKNGILQFKYVGQSTFDRPKPEYIFNFIKKIMNE